MSRSPGSKSRKDSPEVQERDDELEQNGGMAFEELELVNKDPTIFLKAKSEIQKKVEIVS